MERRYKVTAYSKLIQTGILSHVLSSKELSMLISKDLKPPRQKNRPNMPSKGLRKAVVIILRGVHGQEFYNQYNTNKALGAWRTPNVLLIHSTKLQWLLDIQRPLSHLRQELEGVPWSVVLNHPVVRNELSIPRGVPGEQCLPRGINLQDLVPFSKLPILPILSDKDAFPEHTLLSNKEWENCANQVEKSTFLCFDTEYIPRTGSQNDIHEIGLCNEFGMIFINSKVYPQLYPGPRVEAELLNAKVVLTIDEVKKFFEQHVQPNDVMVMHTGAADYRSMKGYSIFTIETNLSFVKLAKLDPKLFPHQISLQAIVLITQNVVFQTSGHHLAIIDALTTLFSYIGLLRRQYLYTDGIGKYRELMGYPPVDPACLTNVSKTLNYISTLDIPATPADTILQVLMRFVNPSKLELEEISLYGKRNEEHEQQTLTSPNEQKASPDQKDMISEDHLKTLEVSQSLRAEPGTSKSTEVAEILANSSHQKMKKKDQYGIVGPCPPPTVNEITSQSLANLKIYNTEASPDQKDVISEDQPFQRTYSSEANDKKWQEFKKKYLSVYPESIGEIDHSSAGHNVEIVSPEPAPRIINLPRGCHLPLPRAYIKSQLNEASPDQKDVISEDQPFQRTYSSEANDKKWQEFKKKYLSVYPESIGEIDHSSAGHNVEIVSPEPATRIISLPRGCHLPLPRAYIKSQLNEASPDQKDVISEDQPFQRTYSSEANDKKWQEFKKKYLSVYPESIGEIDHSSAGHNVEIVSPEPATRIISLPRGCHLPLPRAYIKSQLNEASPDQKDVISEDQPSVTSDAMTPADETLCTRVTASAGCSETDHRQCIDNPEAESDCEYPCAMDETGPLPLEYMAINALDFIKKQNRVFLCSTSKDELEEVRGKITEDENVTFKLASNAVAGIKHVKKAMKNEHNFICATLEDISEDQIDSYLPPFFKFLATHSSSCDYAKYVILEGCPAPTPVTHSSFKTRALFMLPE